MRKYFIQINHKIYKGKIENILKKEKGVINTINPNSFCESLKDKVFKKALLNSNLLVANAIGIDFSLKFMFNSKIPKITGSDIHNIFLNHAKNNYYRVSFIGSKEENLILLKKRFPLFIINIEFLDK